MTVLTNNNSESCAGYSPEDEGWIPIKQRIIGIVCCIPALPLNILVGVVIIRSRQLWSHPRNIYWLGIIFIHLVAVLQQLLAESVIVGCPLGLLLINLSLASLDRYLALAHPQFYRTGVTVKNAGTVLLVSFLLVTGFYTLINWTGYYHAMTLFSQLVLSLILVVVQILLASFIRKFPHYDPPSQNIELTNIYHLAISSCAVTGDNGERGRNQRINRIEWRSARILNLTILPFSTIALAMTTFSSLFFVIRGLEESSSWLTISDQLVLFHSVCAPFVFITRREFRAALRRFCRPPTTPADENFN